MLPCRLRQTTTQKFVHSLISPIGSWDMQLFFEPETLREIIGVHVGVASHQPKMPGGVTSTLIKASFLGVYEVKVHGKNPQSSFDIHPRLGDCSFAPTDGPGGSFFVIDCSQVADNCCKTAPDVSLQSSLPAHSSVILAASAVNLPSVLHLLVELPCFIPLLTCSSIASFLILCSMPEKKNTFCNSSCTRFHCSTR